MSVIPIYLFYFLSFICFTIRKCWRKLLTLRQEHQSPVKLQRRFLIKYLALAFCRAYEYLLYECKFTVFDQKQFMDDVKKALSSQHGYSRQLQEAAAIAAVNLCKSSTYVNFSDRSNVLFSLVQSIVVDLKVFYSRSASRHRATSFTYFLENDDLYLCVFFDLK